MSESNNNAIIIMSTYPNDSKKLKQLIIPILKKGLAKCVQKVNYMKSYYIREGKVTSAQEKLLIMKTTEDKKGKLIEFYKKMHPYEVPEIIILKPSEVDEKYLSRLQAK